MVGREQLEGLRRSINAPGLQWTLFGTPLDNGTIAQTSGRTLNSQTKTALFGWWKSFNLSDALTIIGMEQSLDGDMTVQVKVLEEKATALCICI